ncbi:hypothetical protein QBC41DRAFT_320865 [Cercophora samala]|uniref:Uncharacterized protein n=1 Tax=Cercophora samala TaxID=330535 RepID=A0AA39ZDE7_9PEZI|nr:hypothetical protein QBC41DRAFT_320865 [Cercophora samala]
MCFASLSFCFYLGAWLGCALVLSRLQGVVLWKINFRLRFFGNITTSGSGNNRLAKAGAATDRGGCVGDVEILAHHPQHHVLVSRRLDGFWEILGWHQ